MVKQKKADKTSVLSRNTESILITSYCLVRTLWPWWGGLTARQTEADQAAVNPGAIEATIKVSSGWRLCLSSGSKQIIWSPFSILLRILHPRNKYEN